MISRNILVILWFNIQSGLYLKLCHFRCFFLSSLDDWNIFRFLVVCVIKICRVCVLLCSSSSRSLTSSAARRGQTETSAVNFLVWWGQRWFFSKLVHRMYVSKHITGLKVSSTASFIHIWVCNEQTSAVTSHIFFSLINEFIYCLRLTLIALIMLWSSRGRR